MFSHYLSLLALLVSAVLCNPKRGMISDLNSATYNSDVAALTSTKVKSVSWYYSFGHYPDPKYSARYQFTLQQFGIDTTSDNGNKCVPSITFDSLTDLY